MTLCAHIWAKYLNIQTSIFWDFENLNIGVDVGYVGHIPKSLQAKLMDHEEVPIFYQIKKIAIKWGQIDGHPCHMSATLLWPRLDAYLIELGPNHKHPRRKTHAILSLHT